MAQCFYPSPVRIKVHQWKHIHMPSLLETHIGRSKILSQALISSTIHAWALPKNLTELSAETSVLTVYHLILTSWSRLTCVGTSHMHACTWNRSPLVKDPQSWCLQLLALRPTDPRDQVSLQLLALRPSTNTENRDLTQWLRLGFNKEIGQTTVVRHEGCQRRVVTCLHD